MRSISGALGLNGLVYVVLGLFMMFSPASFASALDLTAPAGGFYAVIGAAATIGFGLVLLSMANSFTPASVNGAVIGNVVVIIAFIYQLLVVKPAIGGNTGTIIMWVVVVLLALISIAESTLLQRRRRLYQLVAAQV